MCILLSHVGKSVTTGAPDGQAMTDYSGTGSSQPEHYSTLGCNNSATPGVRCQGLYIMHNYYSILLYDKISI